jgi:hypothetical protein
MRSLKIAIMSKPEHAKSHVKALIRAGHEAVVIGPTPITIPPSFDLIVYRPSSVSHKAADRLKLERNGRPVIFSDSLDEIVEKSERFALTGSIDPIVEPTMESEEEEDMAAVADGGVPIKGEYHIAYWIKRDHVWSVRRGKKQLLQTKSLDTARRKVMELDAAYSAELALKQPGLPVEPPSSEADPVSAPTPVVLHPAPVIEPGDDLEADDRLRPYVPMPTPPIRVQPTPEEELRELLVMVTEQLGKMKLNAFTDTSDLGITITLHKRHLFGPEGIACGNGVGPTTASLGLVTCETCKNTQLYKLASWVLANKIAA